MMPLDLGLRTSSTSAILTLIAALFLGAALLLPGGKSLVAFAGFVAFALMWAGWVRYLRDRWT